MDEERVEEVNQAVESCRHEGFQDEALRTLLKKVFKHDDFRGSQLEIVRRVLDGKSTLAVLPTGLPYPSDSWPHEESEE